MDNSVKERIKVFISYKGMSIRAFERSCNLSNGYINSIEQTIMPNKLKTISLQYPELNTSWLLTGDGEMLKTDNSASAVPSKNYVPKGGENYKLVPLFHIDSVGGLHSNNEIVNETQYTERFIPFVNAQEGDIAIVQTGTSMIPTIPPGSILQLRKVENWREYFGYGNIFVIELTDGRRITKEVSRYDSNPKEFIWCISHNPGVPDEELPKSMIVSVWKVIKVLTDKGW